MRWLLLLISILLVLTAAAVAPDAAETAKSGKVTKAKPAETEPKAQMSAAEMRKIADQHYKQCLSDWDAATHMTKKEWQRTCRRLADNRTKFRLEMGGSDGK
jgi:hypothetical protein